MVMKTMLLLQKLNKFLILLFILVSAGIAAAETKWEVAIVFRGEGEDEQFQKDIDENILELARINPQGLLKIGIYRESEGRSYSYLPGGLGKKEITLGDVLYRQDLNQIKIAGTLKKNARSELNSFLKSFYKEANSKKALIIYSHGKGADGLRGLSTADFKATLSSLPHLDMLWLDACYMANLEFLYEIKSFSDYTISSEEAEFSSGLPFWALSELSSYSSGKEASIALAKSFIESYSYLKNGKQRQYVTVSSATISIVENVKLDSLAQSLKSVSAYIKKLNPDQLQKLKKNLLNKASMDNKSLVDLGMLLIEVRKMNNIEAQDRSLTSLIRLLNVESVKKLKTSPRIHLENPSTQGFMVYGFNNWQDGTLAQVLENGVFERLIKHDGFVPGPHKSQWPYKQMKTAELVITPFAPGINVFNYYFLNADGKLIGPAMSVSRTHDIVESAADSTLSPLLYTAYTQQVGTLAERYTGLNISMPGSVPSMDYFELEFNRLAEWLNL